MGQDGPSRRQLLRTASGAIVGSSLLYGSTHSARARSNKSWPQFRYDYTNAGHASQNSGPVAGIDQQWRFETDDVVNSSPVVVDGTVYIGSDDTNVYALNASDGTEKWRFKTGDWVYSSPAVVDGTVYIGSFDNNVYALNASDGIKKWHFKTDGNIKSSPTVVEETVYIGSGDTNVYALNASDGTEKWRFKTDDRVYSSPTVVDGTVYVGSKDYNFYALNASDGTEQWRFETNGNVDSSPAVVDETVYIGSNDNSIYALNASDSTEQWHFETGDYIDSSPVVVDETVYIGSDDNSVYALNASDGTEQWRFETDSAFSIGDVNSSPAVVDDTVYIGSTNSNVYALTAGTSNSLADTSNSPILPMMLSALGVGGIGAWWYRNQGKTDSDRNGDGSPDSDSTGYATGSNPKTSHWSGGSTSDPSSSDSESSTDHTTTNTSGTLITSSKSNVESPADSGLLNTVNKSLNEGNTLRDEASRHRDVGGYERAFDIYDEAQQEYKNALETANESDLIETDEIEQKLAAVKDDRRESHRQKIRDDVNSLRSNLDHAEELIDEGEFEKAEMRLENLKSNFLTAKDTATQLGFDDLYREINALERQRGDRLRDLSEQLEAPHLIPDEIPRAPNISVDYDALIDEEPIGGGGNADVNKAVFSIHDEDVTLAIKRPRMGGTLHKDAADRILAEAETWDKLDDHDHIVGVVDYGSEPMPWIAMEYMDGGHLGERSGEIDNPQALWTALAVTESIYHAHRRGIAHLDLKPQNVLFQSIEDAWDVPKVADWGLSKHLLEHSKSAEGMSVEYAAPEQFDSDYGQADDITDVYQLGAIFYELFTGRPPFQGQPFKVISMIKADRPTPPSEIAEVPDALDDILLTALAKEKDNRYDDIVYLRDDLEELFDNR